jgi:hypothetical protein
MGGRGVLSPPFDVPSEAPEVQRETFPEERCNSTVTNSSTLPADHLFDLDPDRFSIPPPAF